MLPPHIIFCADLSISHKKMDVNKFCLYSGKALQISCVTAVCEPYCAMRIGFVPSDAVIKETHLDLKGVSFMSRGYEKDIFEGCIKDLNSNI